MGSEVVVVAVIRPLPGHEEEVERAFRAQIVPTHAEDGCELYALHRDRAEPGRLVFVEKWASAEALAAHAASDHLARCAAQVEGRLASPPEVMVLDPLPDGDPALGSV